MGTNVDHKSSNFKEKTWEIVDIFKVSIEYVGFPQSEIDNVNAFYDTQFNSEEEAIKKRIMRLHIEFFGGTNSKIATIPKINSNKQLMEQLSQELKEIKGLLNHIE